MSVLFDDHKLHEDASHEFVFGDDVVWFGLPGTVVKLYHKAPDGFERGYDRFEVRIPSTGKTHYVPRGMLRLSSAVAGGLLLA